MAGRTAQEIAFEDLAGLLREHFDVPPVRVLETAARGELTPDPPGLLKMSVAVEERTGRDLGNRADGLSAATTPAETVRAVTQRHTLSEQWTVRPGHRPQRATALPSRCPRGAR